jgi:hypothetical protein
VVFHQFSCFKTERLHIYMILNLNLVCSQVVDVYTVKVRLRIWESALSSCMIVPLDIPCVYACVCVRVCVCVFVCVCMHDFIFVKLRINESGRIKFGCLAL